MSDEEKKALIMAGISPRFEQYQQVKEMRSLPMREIDRRTRFGLHFIKQCLTICGK